MTRSPFQRFTIQKTRLEHYAQQQACHQWEIEGNIFPLNHNVAGQRPATKIARPSTIRKRAIAVDPLRVVASILSALTQQLKQHHEKIYEVEIERQRTEYCLLSCGFTRV
jgi:hypothetical protein